MAVSAPSGPPCRDASAHNTADVRINPRRKDEKAHSAIFLLAGVRPGARRLPVPPAGMNISCRVGGAGGGAL